MTAPAPLHGGFAQSEMHHVLNRACATAGLDSTGAQLLRGQTNAVIRLHSSPVVVKIARRGTPPEAVARTVALVQWLMSLGYPTVPLHPGVEQPVVIDGHPVTYWTYLPQPDQPVSAQQIALPLRALHQLSAPPVHLRHLDHLAGIRASLHAITTLPPDTLSFLSRRADLLEEQLADVEYTLPPAVLQGDPQHRNALRHDRGAVLCDWDTAAWGQPEWDLVTVEIHCRRFGYGTAHYQAFADAYGFDVTRLPGYPVFRDIRELRMITTNARKAHHRPETLHEVKRRVHGLLHDQDPHQRWDIL